jgi:hypothetical protein
LKEKGIIFPPLYSAPFSSLLAARPENNPLSIGLER